MSETALMMLMAIQRFLIYGLFLVGGMIIGAWLQEAFFGI